MDREEFLQELGSTLSGEVPPAVVRDNLRYYEDYIRTEMGKGRTEKEIMDELGSPRLIARTIIDATPGAGDGAYEEYQPGGRGHFGGRDSDGGNVWRGQAEETEGGYGSQTGGNFRYYDLNKWYWKLLGILAVIGIVMLVLMVVGGILSIVIPMLPVIILVAFVMWLVKGRSGPWQ